MEKPIHIAEPIPNLASRNGSSVGVDRENHDDCQNRSLVIGVSWVVLCWYRRNRIRNEQEVQY